MDSVIVQTAPNRLPPNIAKIAVKFCLDDPLKPPLMVEFDRSRPLTTFIGDICAKWNLDKSEEYALQSDPHRANARFITEKNRTEITSGSILTLGPSPAKLVQDIIDGIKMGDAAKKQSMIHLLSRHVVDSTFAQEFINQQGLDLLLNVIIGVGWDKSPATAALGEVTATTLNAFLELMEHGIVLWDRFDQSFITKIASYVNKSVCDPAVVQSSLTILENLLLYSQNQALVHKEISLAHLIEHLKTRNPDVQVNVLSLINTVFSKAASDQVRQNLAQAIFATRDVFLDNMIPIGQTVRSDISRQLYILQCSLLRTIYPVSLVDIETSDKKIAEIRKISASILAEVPVTHAPAKKHPSEGEELHRIGINNIKNPSEDFNSLQDGSLILDCLHYFATKKADKFRQWVFEGLSRDSSECSLFMASTEVVRILLEIFGVNQSSSDEQTQFDRVIFSSESPFHDAFVIAMETLNGTWKEMRATSQDFLKVMDVLSEQLSLSLRDPPTPDTMAGWASRINEYSYAKVVKVRSERKRAKEELESKAEPIVRLRERLKPEVLSLIAENRFRQMRKGARFAHRESGGTFRFGEKKNTWYCALSTNNQRITYGNVEDSGDGAKSLNKELPVSDIKAILTGKDCPHVKNKKSSALAFSIMLDGDKKTLDFIAQSEHDFNVWTDGLNRLIGQPMTSPLAGQELEKLLTWEIKMTLLGTEGLEIPEKVPDLPPLPTNFDFKR